MGSVLNELGVALAIASQQASSVITVSAVGASLSVLPRAFDNPNSLAVSPDGRLAIATRTEVVVLAASRALAQGHPRAPGRYTHLWLPRTLRYTGEADLHDLSFAGEALVCAATRLSCVAALEDHCSVTPLWQPPFISELLPEDRCHLNGMALDDAGVPRFVTALGATDTAGGWRAGRARGGIVLSVPEGRVVLGGLCLPHSPRLIGGDLYVLNSGAGEVLRLPAGGGNAQVLGRLPGFARGLVVKGDILFIGLSRLREQAGAREAALALGATGKPLVCGVVAMDRRSGRVVGELRFEGEVSEVADLALLPGSGRHGMLNHTDGLHRAALALPEQGFWATGGRGEGAVTAMARPEGRPLAD